MYSPTLGTQNLAALIRRFSSASFFLSSLFSAAAASLAVLYTIPVIGSAYASTLRGISTPLRCSVPEWGRGIKGRGEGKGKRRPCGRRSDDVPWSPAGGLLTTG